MTNKPIVVDVGGVGDYVPLRTAARILGKSYWAVRRFVIANRVPVTKVGTAHLVKLSDLQPLREGTANTVAYQG